jgi:hypothetical protein
MLGSPYNAATTNETLAANLIAVLLLPGFDSLNLQVQRKRPTLDAAETIISRATAMSAHRSGFFLRGGSIRPDDKLGYLMTERALRDPILGFAVSTQAREPWKFLEIEPLMKEASLQAPLVRQLKVANFVFFKVWLLMRQLQIVGSVLVVLLICLLGYAARVWWEREIFALTVRNALLIVFICALSLLSLGFAAKLVNYRKTATEILIGIGMATFGFLVARLHLHVFDKLFLWQGGLSRTLAKYKR